MTNYEELVKALRGKFIAYDVTGNHNSAQLYKDAAAAIEELQAEQKKTVTQIFGEEQMAWEGRCKDLMHHIEDLQAQLPKLGEWQKAKPKGVVTYSDGYAECSHCHETIWLGWGMNFCPHCGTQNKIIDPDDYDGAKMEVQE